MGDDSTSGTSYTPESLLWEQWWPSNQLVPVGSSEDKSSTANSVYMQTGPLIDSSLHGYNVDLTYHWHYINYEMNYMNPGNGLNPVAENMPLFPVSEHGISKESPGQGHWHSPSTQKTSDRKINGYSDDLASRKPTRQTPLGDRDINLHAKKKEKYSPVLRTSNATSNGAHSTQQGNDRIQKDQERNQITAYKFRIKQRKGIARLESRTKELERAHRELSTCVADLTFEVYELKMQLLQQPACDEDGFEDYTNAAQTLSSRHLGEGV
ncbi:hypothetical protein QYS62_011518 [Fusarium acuminatum]|uniref:BZIP domain-containing protein n=1 Tax=Fusarium acuminatum TaxID=5515 RepID=A0ABZ2XB91_9HYPO